MYEAFTESHNMDLQEDKHCTTEQIMIGGRCQSILHQ